MNSIVDLLTISTFGPVSFDSGQLFSDGLNGNLNEYFLAQTD